VVCEDISILQTIHQQAFAIVVISLVTFDLSLFQHLENIAPSPDERLKAVNTLKQAGIACGIALIPIFPFLTDKEIYLSQMFERLQSVHPDFVVWDSLWIHKGRHHDRIQKILKSLDNDLIYRYKRLYRNIRQPSVHYRRHLDQRLLDFCNQYKLAPRIPENLYEHFLPGKIVKKLRQKNHQFLNQNNLS
jgi:DNA repair photolyase